MPISREAVTSVSRSQEDPEGVAARTLDLACTVPYGTTAGRREKRPRLKRSGPALAQVRALGTGRLRAWCEKAPCTDLRSDPTLHQNFYRTTQANAYINHAHQTQAQRV